MMMSHDRRHTVTQMLLLLIDHAIDGQLTYLTYLLTCASRLGDTLLPFVHGFELDQSCKRGEATDI